MLAVPATIYNSVRGKEQRMDEGRFICDKLERWEKYNLKCFQRVMFVKNIKECGYNFPYNPFKQVQFRRSKIYSFRTQYLHNSESFMKY